MNFKTHKKGLIALALVFFMLAPMFAAIGTVHAVTTSGSFYVVQDSNNTIPKNAAAYNPAPTTTTSITLPASPNPIGTVVAFDVMISGEQNVWGWALPTVTWNSAVMSLSKVMEGPFLTDSGDSTDFLVGASLSGQVGGGISDAIGVTAVSPDTTPTVLCTLYFTVVGYGTTSMHIAGTGSSAPYLVGAPGGSAVAATSVADATLTVNSPPLAISLVPHGATSGNSITEPSATSPIGDTFSVDAYIAGAVGNVWGWSLDMTWNTAVLNLESVTQGNYLSQSGTTLFTAPSQAGTTGSTIDNNVGTINGGVSCAYSTTMTATASAGVLATFNFLVVGYGTGSSTISISAGVSQGALLTDSIPPAGISCTLNNFVYNWVAPAATNPTAVATVTNSPFGSTSVNTYTNFGITLSGASSTGGIDQEPPMTACPITSYSWSILLVGASTPITGTGATFALTNSQVGAVPGNIVATLTVNAPVPAGAVQSPGYTSSVSTTLTIQVQPPYVGGVLDIWTQNGGQGANVDASSFGPQQLVDIFAYVSYNGAPVVDKTVSFVVSGPSGTAIVSAATDATGIAEAQYRLPWQSTNPTQYFGEMTINGSVDVAQVTLIDTCNFYYGYQLQVNSAVITNGVVSAGSAPMFNRYGTTNDVVDVTVSVTNTMWNQQTFWLTATIYDNNNVPVAEICVPESINAAAPETTATPASAWPTENTQTYTITLTIPTWAYVGLANLYVNILTAPPTNAGVAWSPQVSAPLFIEAGYNGGAAAIPPQEVLDITYNVINDEDTGLSGYWALDNYAKEVQVWSLGNDQYEVVATYLGTFTTYNGALSPQTGQTEQTGTAGVTGTISGGYTATFTATSFNPSNLATTGYIGTFDFMGTKVDIQKGLYADQSYQTFGTPYNVFGAYFGGYSSTSFNYVTWGWTYTYVGGTGITSVWQNTSAGNSGDIVV